MRKGLIIAVSAVVLFIVATVVVPLLIPASTCIKFIEKRISRHIDARVVVEKFKIQILPYPSYTITGFGLYSKKFPFQGQPIVTAKRIDGTLSFASLIAGRVDTEIAARDVLFDVKFSDGQSNIAFIQSAAPPVQEENKTEPEYPPAPSGEEIKSLPAPNIPDGGAQKDTTVPAPNSFLFEDLIIGVAHAEPSDTEKETPPFDDSLVIRGIEITSGKVQISEGKEEIFSIGKMDIVATELSFDGGLSAEVDLSGVIAGEGNSGTGARANGSLFFDSNRMELAVRKAKLNIANSSINADVSLNLNLKPAAFDIHVASSGLDMAAVRPFDKFFKLPMKAVTWQGPMAVDLVLKGTSDGYEMNSQLDATAAKISFANVFSKGAAFACKTTASFFVQPNIFSIRNMDTVFGKGNLSIKGDIALAGGYNARLSIGGQGFDFASLKGFLPKVADIAEPQTLSFEALVEGPLGGPEPARLTGQFKADKAKVAGVELSEIDATFERANPSAILNGFLFPILKATYLGGTLSGSGSISAGETLGFAFDGVAEKINSSLVPSFAGAIVGDGSLVIKADARGENLEALDKGMKLTGSLLVSKGAWGNLKPLAKTFNIDVWQNIDKASGSQLGDEIKAKITKEIDTFDGLNISFDIEGGITTINSAVWSTPSVEAKMSAKIDSAKSLQGEGFVYISKPLSAEIASQPAQKNILDDGGRINLPFKVQGKTTDVAMKFNPELFQRDIDARTKVPVKAKEVAQPEKKKENIQAKKIERTEAAPKPQKEKKATKKGKSQNQSAPEDVLKVIIGK